MTSNITVDSNELARKKKRGILWLILILSISTIAYLPAVSGEFLNFDDHRFYNHPIITECNLENFKTLVFMKDKDLLYTFNWVALLSFQVNWFLSPHYLGFISFAIGCHAFQTIFFWKICKNITKQFAITVLSTLIFSIHPLHTNHVVWQAIRWHLLGVTFCLLVAWLYLESINQGKSRQKKVAWYLLSVFAYLMITFGRPFYVFLPVALFVLDFLKSKKCSPMLIINKLPFVALAFLNVLMAHRENMITTRLSSEWIGGSFVNTVLTDMNLNLEYFRQLFIPSHLTLVVPINAAKGLFSTVGSTDLAVLKLPPVVSTGFFLFIFVFCIGIWIRYRVRSPLLLIAGIFITLALVQNIPPKRGIAGVFAYRYAVPAVAFAAPLVAVALVSILKGFRQSRIYTNLACFMIAGYVLYLFVMTMVNVTHFKNSENLWTNHVRMLPNSRAGHYYLGKTYHFINKDPHRAIDEYLRARECPYYWGAGALDQRLAEAYMDIRDWQQAAKAMDLIPPRTIERSGRLQQMKATIEKKLTAHEYGAVPQNVQHNESKVIMFDRVHSVRHSSFSEYTKDSIEYNVVQGYGTLHRYLQELGFEVRDHDAGRITPEILKGVDVLLIGIMSCEAMQMNPEEVHAIVEYVQAGGGLHLISDHTNAYDNATLANRLLERCDIKVLDAMIIDNRAEQNSWYTPKRYVNHPVTKGVDILVHQAGAALETQYGIAFSDANSWADRGNPENGIGRFGNKRLDAVEERKPYPVIAAREYGKGRVVVTTDCNLYANSWIFAHCNYKLARNAFSWLAKIDPLPIPEAESEILVFEGTPAYFRANWSSQEGVKRTV